MASYASTILHAVENLRVAEQDCHQSHTFSRTVLHLPIREILACPVYVRAN
jgi:hypothetical protein